MEVNWNPVAGATYYQVYRNPDSDGTPAYGWIANTTDDDYDDYSCSDGVTYCYKIKACNISGCSGYSNEECEIYLC